LIITNLFYRKSFEGFNAEIKENLERACKKQWAVEYEKSKFYAKAESSPNWNGKRIVCDVCGSKLHAVPLVYTTPKEGNIGNKLQSLMIAAPGRPQYFSCSQQCFDEFKLEKLVGPQPTLPKSSYIVVFQAEEGCNFLEIAKVGDV
jgi:hypothetical protein